MRVYLTKDSFIQKKESSYSSLSNNRAGCNKHAGLTNSLNLVDFKSQKLFKTYLRFFDNKEG